MNNQLELFLRETIAHADEENTIAAECRQFMLGDRLPACLGRPGFQPGDSPLYNFTLDLTVADVNILWEQGYHRAEEWMQRYIALSKPLDQELAKLNSRDRKARAPIKEKLARLDLFGRLGHALHGCEYEEAQARLDETVTAQWARRDPAPSADETEYAHADFWESISDRRCLEETWLWTLQDCADVAIAAATADNPEESEEFKRAYLRARRRSSSLSPPREERTNVRSEPIELTRAETYKEHYTGKKCLVSRLANASTI